ncbi:hypothetical protein CAOG_05289 [Capsaspora owczarzaki ATCC 30864]|uniref:Uncharacterized protein n=1 Tax=Capsaspora owczarzaki (strain ATCC 30864) TaxID=595528 RepID=A0A0D2VTR0_CAPO3|nr:hypothetical protein CAOG_05289 [Capsaspora owczarzaki ATCC 30864]KJE94677.1 hypothetical protein CAOG_005289 [Capsaspora owczarzaki ATCC 30864]|eukprot:XP_004346974.1 hypothetical protein CAOG_05289 [Capsaspora owczarzaki ATCC 30864]
MPLFHPVDATVNLLNKASELLPGIGKQETTTTDDAQQPSEIGESETTTDKVSERSEKSVKQDKNEQQLDDAEDKKTADQEAEGQDATAGEDQEGQQQEHLLSHGKVSINAATLKHTLLHPLEVLSDIKTTIDEGASYIQQQYLSGGNNEEEMQEEEEKDKDLGDKDTNDKWVDRQLHSKDAKATDFESTEDKKQAESSTKKNADLVESLHAKIDEQKQRRTARTSTEGTDEAEADTHKEDAEQRRQRIKELEAQRLEQIRSEMKKHKELRQQEEEQEEANKQASWKAQQEHAWSESRMQDADAKEMAKEEHIEQTRQDLEPRKQKTAPDYKHPRSQTSDMPPQHGYDLVLQDIKSHGKHHEPAGTTPADQLGVREKAIEQAQVSGPAIDTVDRPFETGAELHQREAHDERPVVEKAKELGHANVVMDAPQQGKHAVIEELPFPSDVLQNRHKAKNERRQ